MVPRSSDAQVAVPRETPTGCPQSSCITLDMLTADAPGSVIGGVAAFLDDAMSAVPSTAGPTVFDAAAPPALSLHGYLTRLATYGQCSDDAMTIAAVYVIRVARKLSLPINSCNAHRLLLGGFVLAAKYHEDVSYSNRFYAKVGGVVLEEVNRLELAMLTALDWDVGVAPQDFYRAAALHRHAEAQLTKDLLASLTMSRPEVPQQHPAVTSAATSECER
eukprot:TRINITY_DN141_c4_g2_i1.p1 TRINITY_DN141_c4_g2~~TRINITY_DN141_c4_g2_i1.p1  ORF type:complete len:257 (+),score=62.01 TRINITY_DN141_c4_g2_i1:117-773(+)